MYFLHSEWLNGFWIVVFIGMLFIWVRWLKRQHLQRFGNNKSVILLTESHSGVKEYLKRWLLLGVLALLIITLAQPQWGETKKEIHRKGVEIIFLIDTSLSMLAEDVPPSRIEKAKLIMKSFLKQLKGDRIGIVTFAGTGFIQSPLTLDYDAFLLFANSIQVGYIPDAGTSLSEAIETAIKGFSETKRKYHAVVLLSDGEDLEGNTTQAIKKAREEGIRIYTVGIGTEEGAPIPLRSEDGKVSGYKKDRSGNVVITKGNEPLLRQVANETGGLYFHASPAGKEVEWIYRHMQNLERKEFKSQAIVEREDHFQIFLLFAILLLLLEMGINETKGKQKSYV